MIVGSCRTSVFVYDVNGSVHRENIVLYNLYGSEIYELLASCWGPMLSPLDPKSCFPQGIRGS